MRILYIADMRLPTEKAHGVQIMKMCEAFAKEGNEIELVVPKRRNWITSDPFDYYGVERIFSIKKLPTLDLVGIIPKIGLWVESTVFSLFLSIYLSGKSSDIIYSRNTIPLYFLSFFKQTLWWEPHVGSWNFVVRRVLKKIDGLVAITEGGKDYYLKKGVSEDDIVVAHDGVDTDQFNVHMSKNEAREHLGLPQNKYIAMYIGLFDDWKGYRVLLDAAHQLNHSGIEVVMMGGTKKHVMALKEEYPHVIFTGYRPYTELPKHQKAADVLVLPNSSKSNISKTFTSPLKLFAYMASGRPIVASDIPSLREVLDNGNNAVLVKPDDPQSLARSITELLNDTGLSKKIAERALEDVKKYTWHMRAQKILNFMGL